MRIKIQPLLLAATLLAIAVAPLRAQVVADGATNTLNNVTNFFADDVTVGTNGSFTLLILANNALLTNSGHGYVGKNAGANSNTVRLAGVNTRWLMSGDVFAGRDGAGNQLVLSNGSVVRSGSGYLGYNSTSSSNVAVVTGAGSQWANAGNFYVGFLGARNQLVATNGGAVRNNFGYLGYFSASNSVVVTGTGSGWTNDLELAVGYNGGGNQLLVSNGGLVRDHSGILGYGSTSSSNVAVVTGAGSLWTNAYVLYVGYNGAGNQLLVSNGGVVRNNIGRIGVNLTSSSNVVAVTGAGSLWTNEFELEVGFDGSGNQLLVSNGGTVVGNADCYVGVYGGSNNLAVVSGAGSLWAMATNLYVGFNRGGNQVVVTNGGVVRDDTCHLGYFSGNNLVVVTGTNSLWTNASAFVVGTSASGNKLVVTNGGVVGANVGVVGSAFGISNNVAVVTGAGSLWANQDGFSVGYYGTGNQLVVSNGGMVRANSSLLGAGPSFSSNNLAMVTGAGSRWTNDLGLVVGEGGIANQLVVSNGGAVFDTTGTVGNNSGANFNLALVTGAGSLWKNEDVYVGFSGAGNQLVVSNGGEVRSALGYVGNNSTSSSNTAVVTGSGSLWSSGFLSVGHSGKGNRLEIRNSGVVRDNMGNIGFTASSSNNTVVVTDAGSLWTNSGSLLIGSNGAFNQLIVSAGGMVRAAGLVTLGVAATATNNSVLAMGGSLTSLGLMLGNAASRNNSVTLLSGSIWDLGGGPFIWGNVGSNDTLTIDATSALTNIGGLTLDENHTAFHLTNAPGGYTLNGFTTNQFQFKLTGLDAVIVGNDGPNVQLTISNSTLTSATGIIGNNASAQSNVVLIAGAGSVWSNSSTLNIGNFGSFNQLVVSNGGALRASGLVTLGSAAGSTNNSVLAVDGSLTSAGLTLGNAASRNNSVTLLSGSIWDAGGGIFTWGNAGIGDTLTIDGTSGITNIGALTLDENDTTNLLINGTSLNGLNVGFKTSGLGDLVVGNAGTNVQFTISNFIWAGTSGDIGLGVTSRSNSVFLSGIGSTWSNSGALKIGNGGAFSQLVISNGAQARDNDGYLGFNSSSSNNDALVTGTGSLWSSRSNLVVGNFGGGNRLTISNVATVSASSNVVVGFNSGAASNVLLLSTGAWLTNGGDGVLGWNTGANANSALVSGTNSRWLVGNSLYVGSNGAFNQLVISNAGTLISGSGLSVFTGGGVYVGANATASNNLLSLSAGAQMTNGGNVVLGLNPGANSNTVSVSGANTRWQLLPYAYFYVGNSGAGNRLVISNGAQIKQTGNTVANIGYNSSAINNEVVVTGPNSLWTVAELTVGLFGGGSHLVISDGARVTSQSGWIGPPNSSPPSPVSNNVALVTGVNSRWSMNSGLVVGNSGSGSLVISNGGGVDNFAGIIGANIYGGNNGALVTGANSYWSNQVSLYVGQGGFGCSLVISNGATVDNTSGIIGAQTAANTNEVVVTGAGSVWYNRSDLYVGYDGSGNRLMITNGGTVFANSGVYIGFGFYTTPSNNLLTVVGGSLIVTNPAGSEVLEIRYGANVFHSGVMDVDLLRLTNSAGFFTFNGGTLKTKATTNSNGQLFSVGNGTSAAIFDLVGNGLHTFNNGLAIANNALLRGNGTISGTLTVAIGGTLSPGTSVGKIVLSNAPALLGNVIMEISRNGAVLTNDQIQVAGPLTYGGSLTVSNLGPTALALGNNFKLFAASSYSGSFSVLSLPTPGAGLGWTNKLLLDGSIEVTAGPSVPIIAGISVSGTNLIFTGTNGTAGANYAVLTATNVASPLSNWVSLITNQFGAGGGFSFTNGIAPGETQRYFRIRTP